MNPYDVLGVSPSASTEEIETRYRLLLRECHPDLHYASGPDAVARAEAMTRDLNAAMHRIRSGDIGPAATGRGRTGTAGPTGTGASSPFGTPRPNAYGAAAGDPYGGRDDDAAADQPVPCPFCGVGFLRLADYEAHLVYAHRFRATPAGRRPHRSGVLDVIGKVRYVPMWFVTAIGFFLVFAKLWWLLLIDLSFLALVMWAQTSPRFRNQRRWTVLG